MSIIAQLCEFLNGSLATTEKFMYGATMADKKMNIHSNEVCICEIIDFILVNFKATRVDET